MRRLMFLLVLFAVQLAVSCSLFKNGFSEPQSVQTRTAPAPKYDSLIIKTNWDAPYNVLTEEYVQAKPDTLKNLPKTLRTYTIPVPTKK